VHHIVRPFAKKVDEFNKKSAEITARTIRAAAEITALQVACAKQVEEYQLNRKEFLGLGGDANAIMEIDKVLQQLGNIIQNVSKCVTLSDSPRSAS